MHCEQTSAESCWVQHKETTVRKNALLALVLGVARALQGLGSMKVHTLADLQNKHRCRAQLSRCKRLTHTYCSNCAHHIDIGPVDALPAAPCTHVAEQGCTAGTVAVCASSPLSAANRQPMQHLSNA